MLHLQRSKTSTIRFIRLMKILPAMALAVAAIPYASAGVVDYRPLAGSFASPFDFGGVTATAATSMSSTSGSGLGFLPSPVSSPTIDNNESIKFTFDAGPATGVSFTSTIAFNFGGGSNFLVEGFNAAGVSLGSQTLPLFATFPTYAVSSLYGVPLSAFSVLGDGTNAGLDVATITFSPAPVATPEPATLVPIFVLFAAVLASRFVRRQRARV